jgi:hypothetical protein
MPRRKICLMDGVRQYGNEDGVDLYLNEMGRLVVVAYNEAGYCATEVDLLDLVDWLRANPERLKPV